MTPPRSRRNAGGSHDQSNAEEPAENAFELDDKDDKDDAADEVSDKPKRHRELNVYETVKRRVTGEMAEFETCDIQHHLELEARKLMNESGLMKTPNHKKLKPSLDCGRVRIAYQSLRHPT